MNYNMVERCESIECLEELMWIYSSKKVAEDLENVLKRDFTTTSINEKWVGDITYIHTIKDGWCYLASVLDSDLRTVIIQLIGNIYFNKKIILKNIKNHLFIV